MGRKKRKIDSTIDVEDGLGISESNDPPGVVEAIDVNLAPPQQDTAKVDTALVSLGNVVAENEEKPNETAKKVASSSYAMTSHSGELIQEDVYVSDGSLDSDDEVAMEVVLTGSRMGIMRRGLHHQMMALQQPNRQWKRQDAVASTEDAPANTPTTAEIEEGVTLSPEETEELKRKREEEELAQLDPAQRAARLLIEKQRREAEAKIEERRRENEENVSRDPTLFSKRTAYDIRFDQIDDKPWERGVGSSDNHSEFFNYGLSEEDWLEYAAQQLIIRQELIDAYKQKRLPDPAIVPIQPPAKPEEPASVSDAAVTVAASNQEEINEVVTLTKDVDVKDDGSNVEMHEPSDAIPTESSVAKETILPKKEEAVVPKKVDVLVGVGGAWGAGAVPGSFLARLIEEQEKGEPSDATSPVKPDPVESRVEHTANRDVEDNDSYRGNNEFVKSERDYGHFKRRGSGGDADDLSNRDGDDSSHVDGYDDAQGGRHWNRHAAPPPSQGWHQPPPPPPPPPSHRMDTYNSYHPASSHGSGYQGRGSGRGGGASGGRGGRSFPPRGGGRGGGRGYYNNRDAGSSGRGGDYYQDQQHSGWKRPRNDDDPRRRY